MGKVGAAEVGEVGLVGKFAKDAGVLEAGIVGTTEFAIAFAEAKNGGGGELAIVIKAADGGLVGLNGGFEVVIGLFLEKAFAEEVREFIGLGESKARKEAKRSDKKNSFHGVIMEKGAARCVMVLQYQGGSQRRGRF